MLNMSWPHFDVLFSQAQTLGLPNVHKCFIIGHKNIKVSIHKHRQVSNEINTIKLSKDMCIFQAADFCIQYVFWHRDSCAGHHGKVSHYNNTSHNKDHGNKFATI